MKVSKTLVFKIVIGLAVALITVCLLSYLIVLPKDKAENTSKETEKAKDMATEVKISAEGRPGEMLITNAFIDNDLVMEVLPAIAKQAGISIIPDASVSGLVTCSLKDVPLDRALDIILDGTPYIVKKTPDYYLVCPRDIKNL